jgi:hypothetical protein
MTRFTTTLVLAALAGCSHGFTVVPAMQTRSISLYSSMVDEERVAASESISDGYTLAASVEKTEAESIAVATAPAPEKKVKKSAAKGHGTDGLLAPFVILMKDVLGEKELNQLRGKVIGLHSEVIGKFVDTADSTVGELALRALFELADEDNNGTIEEEELAKVLQTLGFRHLKEKQIKGIFARADEDSNGSIDYEEWKKSAPKTLRTNLIKLAKTNGGELGFLA